MRSKLTGVLCGGMIGLTVAASQAGAAALNILSLGDSITYGQGDGATSGDNYRGGYRYYLQDLLNNAGVSYNFIGPESAGSLYDPDLGGPLPAGYLPDGTTAFDPDHAGYPGWSASQLTTQIQGGNFFVDNGSTPAVADVVLLHIGTNTVNGWNSNSVTDATTQLGTLLGELQTQWTNGKIASDAQIILADILPKARSGSGDPNNQEPVNVLTNGIRYSLQYNNLIDSVIAGLDDTFESLFQRVDMFEIDVNSPWVNNLTLSNLADLNKDGDDYIDWVLGIDESDINSIPTWSFAGVNDHILNLYDPTNPSYFDRIHPSSAGYEIMANVFFTAIPEPGSLLLLTAGVAVLARRRRIA